MTSMSIEIEYMNKFPQYREKWQGFIEWYREATERMERRKWGSPNPITYGDIRPYILLLDNSDKGERFYLRYKLGLCSRVSLHPEYIINRLNKTKRRK